MNNDTNVTWHENSVTREMREDRNEHSGCVIWFTGLSGSGKSTVANTLDHMLFNQGIQSVVLDGDNVRHGLNAGTQMLMETHGEEFSKRFGLGFSAIDREENIRRIGAVAGIFATTGTIALTAFISPYRTDRDKVRDTLKDGEFIEVFVDAPLEVCEQRDPKGLYKKARAGEIKGFTGIDDPYEEPHSPELVLMSAEKTPDQLAEEIIVFLKDKGIISDGREVVTKLA